MVKWTTHFSIFLRSLGDSPCFISIVYPTFNALYITMAVATLRVLSNCMPLRCLAKLKAACKPEELYPMQLIRTNFQLWKEY